MKKVPILSFFSGPGGLDSGFISAGYQPIAAFDNFSAAIETYTKNIGSNVYNINLGSIKPSEIAKLIESQMNFIKPVGIIGGPPCQYFSIGNVHKNPNDERRFLPLKYAELLKYFKKRYNIKFFLFENVSGITINKHKDDLNELVKSFKNAGFNLKSMQLNAAHFGIPQIRKRFFIFGLSNSFDKTLLKDFALEPLNNKFITIRKIIENIPEPLYYKRGMNYAINPVHPNHVSMNPVSTKFKEGIKNRQNSRSFRILDWDKPSWTVAYGNREMHIHPEGHRRVSVYEAMLFQGFPKNYRLYGSFSDQVKQVSDAVPPPLAKVVALSIKRTLHL